MTPATPPPRYWFPAKRYGWGWGPPSAWQGWVVFMVYFTAFTGLLLTVFSGAHPFVSVAGLCALSVGLVAVCWLKGEPPRWRWGN